MAPELTDELIEKICKTMERGFSYPYACEVLLISCEVSSKWFVDGKYEKEQKSINLYKRIRSVKRDQKIRMNSHQHRIILKCYHTHQESMDNWCDFLCKTPFELDQFEAEKMIYDLKLGI
jgi:hypothetical protein